MSVIHNKDIAAPVSDKTTTESDRPKIVSLPLHEFFDDDVAKSVLELSVGEAISAHNVLIKSMFEFDLDSEDGTFRLLELLPILDPEIVKTIMQEIWPGYPIESLNFDITLARAEIRGYLLDFLGGHGTEAEDIDHTDEAEPDGGAETPEPSEAQDSPQDSE